MAGYIPDTETEKIVWLENFTHWVALNGATHGISVQEIAELDTRKIAASTALIDSAAAQDAARGATANKNNRISEALVLARDLPEHRLLQIYYSTIWRGFPRRIDESFRLLMIIDLYSLLADSVV